MEALTSTHVSTRVPFKPISPEQVPLLHADGTTDKQKAVKRRSTLNQDAWHFSKQCEKFRELITEDSGRVLKEALPHLHDAGSNSDVRAWVIQNCPPESAAIVFISTTFEKMEEKALAKLTALRSKGNNDEGEVLRSRYRAWHFSNECKMLFSLIQNHRTILTSKHCPLSPGEPEQPVREWILSNCTPHSPAMLWLLKTCKNLSELTKIEALTGTNETTRIVRASLTPVKDKDARRKLLDGATPESEILAELAHDASSEERDALVLKVAPKNPAIPVLFQSLGDHEIHNARILGEKLTESAIRSMNPQKLAAVFERFPEIHNTLLERADHVLLTSLAEAASDSAGLTMIFHRMHKDKIPTHVFPMMVAANPSLRHVFIAEAINPHNIVSNLKIPEKSTVYQNLRHLVDTSAKRPDEKTELHNISTALPQRDPVLGYPNMTDNEAANMDELKKIIQLKQWHLSHGS